MKPRVKKIIKMIPFLEIGLCLILLIVSFLIKDRPYKITFTYADKKIISHSWHDIFSSVIVTVCLIFLLLTVACIIACIIEKIRTKEKNNKYISIHCFTFFLCYFIIMFCDILVIGLWTEEDYSPFCYEFSDSNHTIVIEEESFLLYGGANVYQINDNNEAIIIHKFHTDDGGRNHGQYDIKWYENYAEITYNTCDLENTKHTDRITFVD